MSNFLLAVSDVINVILSLLLYAIILRAILSWFTPNPNNPFLQLIHKMTDPILTPIQRIIPNFGGLDLSPIVALLLIQGIRGLIENLLFRLM